MNGIPCFLLRCSLLIGVLFGMSSCRTSSLFTDKYDVSGVYRTEVSGFKENNYNPIDCEKFIEIIKTSKQGLAKFIPKEEVMMFNVDGDSTKLYFSEDNKYLFIGGIGYFELSDKNATILSELFNVAELPSIDDLTGLSVYKLAEIDTLPLCNGLPFTEGFLPEFLRRFHPEKSDDNPFRFTVMFVIDKDGKLVGPRIQGKTPDMLGAYEKHVLETVNQIQDWEPGKVDGTPVNTFLSVPVIF